MNVLEEFCPESIIVLLSMGLKSSEIKEFLVLMDQYNIEIFSCFLRLLCHCALYIFHQTNVGIVQDPSEDMPEFSRNSIAPSSTRRKFSGTTSVHFRSPMDKVLVDRLARVRLCCCFF